MSSSDRNNVYLDTIQLGMLERAFRKWVDASPRKDVRLSRRRILFIFLLIRYTGAKLNEILSLNPFEDIDPESHSIRFRATEDGVKPSRIIQISESLSLELTRSLEDTAFKDSLRNLFDIDPAFVRRKFYERAKHCGFDKRLGSPEMIRKARAVELMQGNLPIPAVQMMLGQSAVTNAVSHYSFSEQDLQQITRLFMEMESDRRTSARNAFFGKIKSIEKGDVQARIDLQTIENQSVTTIITRNSLERLALDVGNLVTAEVKAPYVMLQHGSKEPSSSADNIFEGTVVRISEGKISTEYVVRISESAELCSVVSTISGSRLDLAIGDRVWALFSCFSVILNV